MIVQGIGSNITPLGAPALEFLGIGMNPSLDNARVPYCTQKAAPLLKSAHDSHCFRVIGLKEDGVEDLPSMKKVVTHCFVDSFIRASAQRSSFDELDCLVAKLSVSLCAIVTSTEQLLLMS